MSRNDFFSVKMNNDLFCSNITTSVSNFYYKKRCKQFVILTHRYKEVYLGIFEPMINMANKHFDDTEQI